MKFKVEPTREGVFVSDVVFVYIGVPNFKDELALRDPIIERFIRAAKKNIMNPPKKSKRSGPEKDLEEVNKKLNEIKKILN